MVIRDDQLHSPFPRELSGGEGGDAAVYGDDQAGAFVADLGDRVRVQAIPFVDSVRDVEINDAAEVADGMPEDGGGGDAIDVIVAVNDDLLLVPNGFGDAL